MAVVKILLNRIGIKNIDIVFRAMQGICANIAQNIGICQILQEEKLIVDHT